MPRREKPIVGDTPIAEFAKQLRAAKDAAHINYRQMSEMVNYSHVHLGRAAKGERFPNWELTRAYLKGCGITDPDQVRMWEDYWSAVDMQTRRPGRRRRTSLHHIKTIVEYGEYLRELAYRDGPAPLRDLQERTEISKSAIADWFNGRALPTAGNVYHFAVMLGATKTEQDELMAARDRLDRGDEYSSHLARTLATLRGHNPEAAGQVAAALVKAEKHRVIRVQPRRPKLAPAATVTPQTARRRRPRRKDDEGVPVLEVQVPSTEAKYADARAAAAKLADSLTPPGRHAGLVAGFAAAYDADGVLAGLKPDDALAGVADAIKSNAALTGLNRDDALANLTAGLTTLKTASAGILAGLKPDDAIARVRDDLP